MHLEPVVDATSAMNTEINATRTELSLANALTYQPLRISHIPRLESVLDRLADLMSRVNEKQ